MTWQIWLGGSALFALVMLIMNQWCSWRDDMSRRRPPVHRNFGSPGRVR